MADTTTHRSSERVRRAIEDTRHQMDETVDALTERFSPDTILDDAWARLKGGDGGIRQMMRDHPIPVALVGVGLGWLAVEQAAGVRESRAYYEGDEYEPEHLTHGDVFAEEGDVFAEEIEDGDSEPGLGERMREGMSSVKENVSSAVSGARERASGAMASAKRRRRRSMARARTGARRAREGFGDMMTRSPLAMGAIAFGLGMASGLSMPATRRENRTMGRASDAFKEEAKRVGEKAKHVASEAVTAARDEAGHVAEAATEAARDTALEEGLAPGPSESGSEHTLPHEMLDQEALSQQRRSTP